MFYVELITTTLNTIQIYSIVYNSLVVVSTGLMGTADVLTLDARLGSADNVTQLLLICHENVKFVLNL